MAKYAVMTSVNVATILNSAGELQDYLALQVKNKASIMSIHELGAPLNVTFKTVMTVDEIEPETPKRKIYTKSERLAAVRYANKHGRKAAATKFGMTVGSINVWKDWPQNYCGTTDIY